MGRVELARSYYRDIRNTNDYFYVGVGKTNSWEDEDNPESPIDSDYYVNDFRKRLMFLQRVTSADACLLVRRIDWAYGTIYDSYNNNYNTNNPAFSGATSLSTANFYVLTDEYKVYKCLDNNRNSYSTIKPTGTGTSPEQLSDGYIWKFMYQVSAADQTKYLDAGHIPVRKLTGNPTFDVNGELDSISVTSGGSGYISAPTVVISGDGEGATATATLSGDTVDSITIDTPGTGYTFAFIALNSDSGNGATATVSLGDDDPLPTLQSLVEGSAIDGTIDRIDIVSTGQDYSEGDATVVISGDGSGAEASVRIADATGSVIEVIVTNAGTGYTWANITIQNSVGIGQGAICNAIISPKGGHGSNAPKELFAKTLGLTLSFSDNANADLIKGNDFRQVGLIKNIYGYDSATLFTELTGTPCFVVNVSDNQYYNIDDEIVTSDGGTFQVSQIVEKSDGTFDVYLVAMVPIILNTSTLTNNSTGDLNLVINSLTTPEVNVKTGEVIYLENRPPINRSSDQVETIKTLIRF